MKHSPSDIWQRSRKAAKKTWRKYRRQTSQLYKDYLRGRTLQQAERFLFAWLGIFILSGGLLYINQGKLADHYLEPGPASGGEFREGMVGELEVINPIFEGDRVSRSVEQLVFSGLFRYDGSSQLDTDLALDYELDESRQVYTVELREDVRWHDGEPLTAEDVAFTFETIKNEATDSSLQVLWSDIEIEDIDEYTVRFELPNPYAPFLHQLTVGIVPEHILGEEELSQLRVMDFNQDPIGTGPFEFNRITSAGNIHLTRYDDYHDDQPQLERFVVAVFEEEEEMVDAYNGGELSSMVAGSDFQESIIDIDSSRVRSLQTTTQVFNFINTDRVEDVATRRALRGAVDTRQVIEEMDGNFIEADSPLRPEHLGYSSLDVRNTLDESRELLIEAGWEEIDDGWEQDGERLSLDLATQSRQQYEAAAASVASQWRELGVEVEVQDYSSSDLQQDIIAPRDYDALIFGVALGPDPDVYAYWHSSQTVENGRNLSQYISEVADINLEDGRTRTDEELRAAKYQAFQEAWLADAPALPLYRSNYYHVQREQVLGANVEQVMSTEHRFHDVENWTINTEPVLKRLR